MTAPGHKRPLRVLTLVDTIGTYGGAERVARQITTHLDQSRFEATFCVSRWEEPHDPANEPALEELREAGTPFLGLRRSSRMQLKPWRELMAYMREHEVDVLHSHMIGSNIWGALIATRLKLPVFVAHEHTWSFQGKPYRKFLDRNLIARRADAFVAVSRDDQRKMIEIERIPESKTRFVPNGLPPPPPPDPDHDFRAELGIEPGQPVVAVVAVLRPQKALDVLLRATPIIRDALPDVRVLIVGGAELPEDPFAEDPVVRSLHRLRGELGLDSTVSFLGPRSDVPDLLRAIDVAVLSSDYEGSPLSLIEYMQAGKPVVATRVGGVPDIVSEGETGLLVEPQDPQALGAAIASLLRDPERAARLGEAGQARSRRLFSMQATADRVGALYEELYALGGRR